MSKSTILSQVKAALSTRDELISSLQAAQAQVSDLTQQVALLLKERDEALAEKLGFEGQLAEVAKQLEDSKRAQENFEKKVGDAVIEQQAALGVPAASLPQAASVETQSTKAELIKAYNEIKDPQERADFYQKNSTKMLG
jgi:uncharacterized coiled-coil DUF342 family protein